ncbi:MAG: hypothetical protein KF846_13635 [Cyclobacteriaceae bacterium]|nr:hypothetical protein [Cyclobacteriaceae bacterium]MBX2957199.1 hypothetical protein [Cyclobacteriaceae bacterium]
MATKALDKNESRIPFLGDKITFITGLDPLGLQNPSSQMYSYLLPGLNNVTWHIRNYSFYCWLLSEYGKIITSSDPILQKRFIRRAEYIISLMSVHNGIEGVSGSEYARKQLEKDINSFDLQEGTYNNDGTTEHTYWQYGFGIFGQYYVGSLRQIGLIEEPVNEAGELIGIFRRTSRKEGIKVSGEELAKAFDKNVSDNTKSSFLNSIQDGKVSTKQLESFMRDFNITKVPFGTLEHELLISLLIDIDEPLTINKLPTAHRKETLFHLLRFAKKNKGIDSQYDFSRFSYKVKGTFNRKRDLCLTGWYYYQLNEYWQVACTAILNGCLHHLEDLKGPGWMPLIEFINTCRNAVMKAIIKNKVIRKEADTLSRVSFQILPEEEELYDEIMKAKGVERMYHGFIMLFKLYDINHTDLEGLRVYSQDRAIGDDNYDVITFFTRFSSRLEQPVDAFIYEFLLNSIINRHLFVAYNKMGSRSQSTQKFIIEEGHIRQIGNFDPDFTSPRIRNLLRFLLELSLLDENYKPTAAGVELLSTIDQ